MATYLNRLSTEDLEERVRRFCEGDVESFQVLYRHYAKNVLRFCVRMLTDYAAAQDALQETFIRVYEHRYECRGENFNAWVYTIARRVCYNSLRSKKAFDEFNEEFHCQQKQQFTDTSVQLIIQKALDQMPFVLKEALVLREYEGYSYQEIADIIGSDLSLAKVRVHRARLLLRKILAPIMEEQYDV